MSENYRHWWSKFWHRPADDEIIRRQTIIAEQTSAINKIVNEFHKEVKKNGSSTRTELAK